MKKIFIPVILFFLLIPSLSLAASPSNHEFINDGALADSRLASSPIAQLSNQYRNFFDSGYMITDVSILYYSQTGPYPAEHAWNFQTCIMSGDNGKYQVTPQIQAYSYGVAAHLIVDSVYHNLLIPQVIKQTYVLNMPIHAIKEGLFETRIEKDHAEAYLRAQLALNTYFSDTTLQQLTQDCASKTGYFNVYDTAVLLNNALGSPNSYLTKIFKLPYIYQGISVGDIQGGLIALFIGVIFALIFWKGREIDNIIIKILSYILLVFAVIFLLGAFIFLTGGITTWIPSNDVYQWSQLAEDKLVYYFTPEHWSERTALDPTGFAAINQAETTIWPLYYVLGAVVVISLSAVILKKLDKI